MLTFTSVQELTTLKGELDEQAQEYHKKNGVRVESREEVIKKKTQDNW